MISQQIVLENIVAIAKEVFERKLNLNPNDISFVPEYSKHELIIKTHNFRGTISKYEREQYYALRMSIQGYSIVLRMSIQGYSIVIGEDYDKKVTFYIDDGDYGRVEDYDKEKVANCLATIHDGLTELLN